MTDSTQPVPSQTAISNALTEVTHRAHRVRTAPPQQWTAAVADLVAYCRDDVAVSLAVERLKAKEIDIARWWHARTQAVPQGTLGSGPPSLDIPTDAEEKAALAFHFLTYAVDAQLDYHRVAVHLAGLGGNMTTRLGEVYELLVGPLLRFVQAKLREVGQPVESPHATSTPMVRDASPSAPTSFVSYCWEDAGHRAWVLDLATRLRADGIDVQLDHWEVAPGDKLPLFMERAVRDNQYVLIVCTPTYKERSDKRTGGVGYEGDIMTAESLRGGPPRKFIPILRRGAWDSAIPTWLDGKYGVDLSGAPDDPEYSAQYQDLLVTLRGERSKAPRLGNPTPTDSRPSTGSTHPADPGGTAIVAESDDRPIRITGIIVDRVTTPSMDGTRGSALYRVPFRLSRRPSHEWVEAFVRTWDHPPRSTGMHRPGTASVEGDVVWLNKTTLDEVQQTHRETLRLVTQQTNEIAAARESDRRRRADAERRRQEEHREEVRRKANEIKFDD